MENRRLLAYLLALSLGLFVGSLAITCVTILVYFVFN